MSRDGQVAATPSPHRRSVIDEARLCYAAHYEQMLVSYPELRMKPWDEQDAAVRERFDYQNGETIWQRECPYCDLGLLLAPVRFCQRCQGSGYLTTTVDPTRAER